MAITLKLRYCVLFCGQREMIELRPCRTLLWLQSCLKIVRSKMKSVRENKNKFKVKYFTWLNTSCKSYANFEVTKKKKIGEKLS